MITEHDLRIALHNLTNELQKYRIDITVVQEIRWLGQGIMERKRDTVYYSCNNNNKHEFGTGFIVKGRMRNFIVDFKAVNERICY